MKIIIAILAVTTLSAIGALAQGFLNLDFESAQNLPGNPSNGILIPVTNALPDWTALDGSLILSEIFYGSNTLEYTENATLEGGTLALSGEFSAGLYDGGSISQTGLVPDNAESLEFEASPIAPISQFSVILGGQTLSYSVISQGPNYIDEYAANIPISMEGKTEDLVFSCEGPGSGNVLLDDIQFSSSPAPEPGELALIGLAAGLLYMRKQNKGLHHKRTQRARRNLTADGHR